MGIDQLGGGGGRGRGEGFYSCGVNSIFGLTNSPYDHAAGEVGALYKGFATCASTAQVVLAPLSSPRAAGLFRWTSSEMSTMSLPQDKKNFN